MKPQAGGPKARRIQLPKFNVRNQMDGRKLMSKIAGRTVDMAIIDPQYRGVLDKMGYGNEGERQKKRAELAQMDDETIQEFIVEIGRVLKPSAYLVLWVDKFGIAEASHHKWLRHAPQLRRVDLLSWNKIRIGMGRRLRCLTEYAVIVQKIPLNAKETWSDHRLPDSWVEYSDREVHAHAKPVALIQRLIKATTKPGALVLDPCAGGYGVLEACKATGRDFVGCDLV